MDNQSLVYMAYDGDNAGRLCGRAILADNPDALHEVSARINLGHEVVKRWVESHGGQFISGGGDEGVFSIPEDAIHSVEELRADYQYATNLTATVGIGKTLSEAGKAMLVGKFRGKNTVVQYDPSIESEIQQAQVNLGQGTASPEEKKIGEAYLQPEGNEMKSEENNHTDCQYCQATDATQVEDPSHCKYCHNDESLPEPCEYCDESASADVSGHEDCQYCQAIASHNPEEEGHPSDCQYCQDMSSHDPNAEGHSDDCEYCQHMSQPDASGAENQVEPTDGPTVQNPTTIDSENYAGQDLNNPDLPKPEVIQHNPDGLGTSFDAPTNENVKLDAQGQGAGNEKINEEVQSADPQSEETVQEIAQQIDALPNYESAPQEEVIQVDAADMATGTSMEGPVSRPEGYADDNTPRDMGLAEDGTSAPDVTSLMQEGLDSHADGIQREKVINLISEALVGFKSCKGILEKAKAQAPQLYKSSIDMLKAMIEMAKMLGLDQEAETGDGSDPLGDGAQSASPEYESANGEHPGDAHTAENAAPGEPANSTPDYEQAGENPEKKSEGAIGQSIGKLPTKATTEHVPRTPQLPNAVNAKGQKKVIDPVTGKVRWIDMREGKVQSPTGVPVKPASQEEEGDGPKIRDKH